MKNKNGKSSIVIGIGFIIGGIIFAGNVLGFWNVEIFFDGWWTLFIIVPSLSGLFTNKSKWGSFISLAIGVLLLLSAQDVLKYENLWKAIVPIVFVLIGLRMIFGKKHEENYYTYQGYEKKWKNGDYTNVNEEKTRNSEENEPSKDCKNKVDVNHEVKNQTGLDKDCENKSETEKCESEENKDNYYNYEKNKHLYRNFSAIFGGNQANLSDVEIKGVGIVTVFGGMCVDMSRVIVDKKAEIKTITVFGGTEIFLPPEVNVEITSVPIFGGISNKNFRNHNEGSPTIHIKNICIFGGVELK